MSTSNLNTRLFLGKIGFDQGNDLSKTANASGVAAPRVPKIGRSATLPLGTRVMEALTPQFIRIRREVRVALKAADGELRTLLQAARLGQRERARNACNDVTTALAPLARSCDKCPEATELLGTRIFRQLHTRSERIGRTMPTAELESLNTGLDKLQANGVKDPVIAHLSFATKVELLNRKADHITELKTVFEGKEPLSMKDLSDETLRNITNLRDAVGESLRTAPEAGVVGRKYQGGQPVGLLPSYGNNDDPLPGTRVSLYKLEYIRDQAHSAAEERTIRAVKLVDVAKLSKLPNASMAELKSLNDALGWLTQEKGSNPRYAALHKAVAVEIRMASQTGKT